MRNPFRLRRPRDPDAPDALAGFRWPRVIVAIVAGELAPILVLFLATLVHALRTGDPDPAAYAARTGLWLGPAAGIACAFLLAAWAGRASPAAAVRQGAFVGVAIAMLDFGILALAGEPFRVLFLLSNAGKIAAAVAGGWLVARAWRGRSGAPA